MLGNEDLTTPTDSFKEPNTSSKRGGIEIKQKVSMTKLTPIKVVELSGILEDLIKVVGLAVCLI
jgi:hypothetical protein